MEHGIQRSPDEPQRPTYDEIYNQTKSIVWAILRGAGLSASQDAMDLVHTIYLTAFRKLYKYDPAVSLRSWVALIAWHTIRSYQRKAYRRREILSMDNEIDAIEDPTLNAEAQIAIQERERIVCRILEEIDQEPRMVFILHEDQGFDMDDVAYIMGISRATAYRYLDRAKKSFKKAVLRLPESERSALGLSVIVAGALTESAFDTFLAKLHSMPRSGVPAEIRDEVWARLRVDFPDLPESPDGPPISGTRLTPAPAHPRTQVPANPPANVPLHALAQLSTGQLAGLLVGVFFAGAAAKTALDHVIDPPPNRTDAAIVAVTERVPVQLTAAPSTFVIIPSATLPKPAPIHAASLPATTTKPPKADKEAKDLTESAITEEARQKLESGQAAQALKLTEQLKRDFPKGTQAQERDVIQIQALVKLGQKKRAAAELASFRKSYPGSALLSSLADAVGEAPPAR